MPPYFGDIAGSGIVGRQGQRHRAELVELGQEIPRATIQLQHRVVIIGGVDAEALGGVRHHLRQAKGANRAARPDGKPGFLLHEALEPDAELDRVQPGAGKTRVARVFLRGGDDHLFDAGLGIAEKPGGIGVVVLDGIEDFRLGSGITSRSPIQGVWPVIIASVASSASSWSWCNSSMRASCRPQVRARRSDRTSARFPGRAG
jgi:hypothetical protein